MVSSDRCVIEQGRGQANPPLPVDRSLKVSEVSQVAVKSRTLHCIRGLILDSFGSITPFVATSYMT